MSSFKRRRLERVGGGEGKGRDDLCHTWKNEVEEQQYRVWK